MDPQTRESVSLQLEQKIITNAGRLGSSLCQIQTLYNAACTEMGFSENSLEVEAINTANSELTIKGLEIPALLTKYLVETGCPKFSDLLVDLRNYDEALKKLYEHIAKGLENIDKQHLEEHIWQSVSYWFEHRKRVPDQR